MLALPTAMNSRTQFIGMLYLTVVKAEAATRAACTEDSDAYGWPIGSWCVGDIADMSELFYGLSTFNEDISEWNVSQVVTK